MYHRFGIGDSARKLGADCLDKQLRLLCRHFNVVRLRDLVSRLKSGVAIDPLSVVLTVDDAYADFGKYAYPVFRKHGVPVTLYVVSEFAGGRWWLWWDAIRYLLNETADGDYRLIMPNGAVNILLNDSATRNSAWLLLASIGVTLSAAERKKFIDELQRVFEVSLLPAPPSEFAALSWNELRKLDPDVVEIGAHTRTHPILSRCDSARIVEEVTGSKRMIEEQLGRPVSAFCYPNGERPDVDERCITAVREAGFDSAVMACGSMVRKGANPYLLERMASSHRLREFESDVSGISYLRRLMTKSDRLLG
jgi:peptidoglycan/xylan/chitin deacetylase (PgdA/CDA1 family)